MAVDQETIGGRVIMKQPLPIPKEEDDQLALAQLLDSLKYGGRPLQWMHCPNEGKRKPQYIAKLKRLGLKSGFPDVIIFDSPPCDLTFKGAVIELKRVKRGVASDEQRDWINYFFNNQWRAAICHGIDQALEQLRYWGYLR